MTTQLNIDFTSRQENNADSQMMLIANKRRINSQVITVMRLLAYGHVLTVRGADRDHDISHLPRRIKDIEEFISKDLKACRSYNHDRYATYYFDEEQKIKAISILKGIE